MDFITYILDQSAWLYTKIYQNKLFFFDLWSIAHLLNGFGVYLLVRSLRVKHPLIRLTLIIFLYEAMEILFIYFAFMVFHPETIKDQFTDMFVGIIGALICSLFLKISADYREKHPIPLMLFSIFMISFTYAFFWVGFYHYQYNVEACNFPGINWLTVAGWVMGGMLILFVFIFIPVRYLLLRISLSWICFFIALLIFEYFAYYVLEVRETSGVPLKPLIFGLVHGTKKMHIFYVLAPFIIISLYALGDWMVRRSTNHLK